MCEQRLVVALSSRALFDLREEAAVFDSEGLEAYLALQCSRSQEPLRPGVAFPLVRRLLGLNQAGEEPLVAVILASRNDPVTGARVMRSIEEMGLRIETACFTAGAPVAPYLSAFGVDLFLSAEPEDVAAAQAGGVAAAVVLEHDLEDRRPDDPVIRIAFDGDSTLWGESADRVFQEGGLKAFHDHEQANGKVPLEAGPFTGFLQALCLLKRRLEHPELVRTSLVTARAVVAHARALATLEHFGLHVDEAFFLGGRDKTEVLQAFGADFFFDDSPRFALPASRVVPTGRVLRQLDGGRIK